MKRLIAGLLMACAVQAQASSNLCSCKIMHAGAFNAPFQITISAQDIVAQSNWGNLPAGKSIYIQKIKFYAVAGDFVTEVLRLSDGDPLAYHPDAQGDDQDFGANFMQLDSGDSLQIDTPTVNGYCTMAIWIWFTMQQP